MYKKKLNRIERKEKKKRKTNQQGNSTLVFSKGIKKSLLEIKRNGIYFYIVIDLMNYMT